jgi:hypothetical protein
MHIEAAMSETDEYILDTIKIWVWSGFYSPSDVEEMIADVLEDDADKHSCAHPSVPSSRRKLLRKRIGPAARIATDWMKRLKS